MIGAVDCVLPSGAVLPQAPHDVLDVDDRVVDDDAEGDHQARPGSSC